jgi:hypothetical protein
MLRALRYVYVTYSASYLTSEMINYYTLLYSVNIYVLKVEKDTFVLLPKLIEYLHGKVPKRAYIGVAKYASSPHLPSPHLSPTSPPPLHLSTTSPPLPHLSTSPPLLHLSPSPPPPLLSTPLHALANLLFSGISFKDDYYGTYDKLYHCFMIYSH